MKLRTVIVTIALLAVLSAIVAFIRRPAPPKSDDPRLGAPLVDAGTIEKASRIRISDQGKSVSLVRAADGKWHVATYYDLAADFSKLSRFTSDLTDAKIERLVTSNPERIARLEFKDTKIELLDNSDKPVWNVTLGKSAESGGRFVRFSDETKAYLASLRAWIDAESKNWADAQLLDVKADDVSKIEIPVADGPAVVLSRAKKEDPWTAADASANQKLKADKPGALLSSLAGLRFTETVDPTDPSVAIAKQYLRTFKLTCFDGKTVTIAIGRKPEEKKLKPPAPSTDGKSGPGALGSVADVTKSETGQASEEKPAEEKAGAEKKPLAPEYETIPAGPVFVFVTDGNASAPINAAMQKRAFQAGDYAVSNLPQNRGDLFEPTNPTAPNPTPTTTPSLDAGSAPTVAPPKP